MIEHQREDYFLATARQKLRIALRRSLAPGRRRGESATPPAITPANLISGALIRSTIGTVARPRVATAHRPASCTEHLRQPLAEEIAVVLLHATVRDQPHLAVESFFERGASLGRVGRMNGLKPPQHLGKRLRAIEQLAHRGWAVMEDEAVRVFGRGEDCKAQRQAR